MKKLLSTLIIAGVLFATAPICEASNWVYVTSYNKMDCYIDTDSIQDIDETTKAAWFNITRTDGKSQKQLVFFNKDKRALSMVSYITYNKKGVVINSYTSHNPYIVWEPIAPDTTGALMYEKFWAIANEE